MEKNLFTDGFKERFSVDVDFKKYPHDLLLCLAAFILGCVIGVISYP